MVPIFFRKHIKEIDLQTIRFGKTSRFLINAASTQFVKWLMKSVDLPYKIAVFCGNGNNGADGYLIAKKLNSYGFDTTVYSITFSDNRSQENQLLQTEILDSTDIKHSFIKTKSDFSKIKKTPLAIDALLGNGIDRPVEGLMKVLIEQINTEFQEIIAVDIPSGLLEIQKGNNVAVQCNRTLSFEFPKHAFFAAENEKYVGHWDYVPIGLNTYAISSTHTSYHLLEKKDISQILQPRISFAHKGQMGRVLIISSNSNMPGASYFMAKACLRSGAGITLIYSKSNHDISNRSPEIIRITDLNSKVLKQLNVVGVGPGLGVSDESTQLIDDLLKIQAKQLVIDADAINIIAANNWQNRIPENAILTPHLKEFTRIFKACNSHAQRVEYQRDMSLKFKIYIILKGRYTSITTPSGELYYNRTGNPALAKGGSGDVLTGMLCGFCAQSYTPLEACLLSVFIHGFAADLYITDQSELSMSPIDLLNLIPKAILTIQK